MKAIFLSGGNIFLLIKILTRSEIGLDFCECGSMVERDLPKVETRVRFPSLALCYFASVAQFYAGVAQR